MIETKLDWQEWDVLASLMEERELTQAAMEFGHTEDDATKIAKAIILWVQQQEPEL